MPHAPWVRLLHWIGGASVLTLAVTGFMILMVHPRLYWGDAGNDLTTPLVELPISRNHQHGGWEMPEPFVALARPEVVGAGRTYDIFNQNGWGRSLHFLAGWGLVLLGLIYLVEGVAGGHIRRHLWPSRRERTRQALADDLRAHREFRFRVARGTPEYGPLQKLTYSAVVFVVLPAAVLTGLAMSPAITAAAPWLLVLLNGFQSARTLHFVLALTIVLFVLAHVLMVVATGFAVQMRGMVLGRVVGVHPRTLRDVSYPSATRRRWLLLSIAGVGAILAERFDVGKNGGFGRRASRELPPVGGHPLRAADTLTYAAQRAALPEDALAPEYPVSAITAFPAVGTIDPLRHRDAAVVAAYRDVSARQFAGYRLQVEGAVARPREFTLDELKALPVRTQVTRHTCEEGWTAVAQWTGVPLSELLRAVEMKPSARFVVFYAIDDLADSLDLDDALHPQTLLAYGMNGQDLPVRHGAPLRLRVERQLGYKSLKYVSRIVVTDHFEDGGPKGDIQNGWSWYAGI